MSKLTLVALPLLGLLAFGCAAPTSDGSETATNALETVPAELAAFDALTPEQQKAALYDAGSLRPGFTARPIRIVDTIPAGPEREAALDAYFELRDYSFSAGGDTPDVEAIEKNGVAYAYTMAASGSYHSGSWGEHITYNRTFTHEIVRYSYAE